MGGRHPRFAAEVDLSGPEGSAIEEVARLHGLVVRVTPHRIGLSSREQIEALQRRFPSLKIQLAPGSGGPGAPAHKGHSPGFTKLVDAAKKSIAELDPETSAKRVENEPGTWLIDVREDNEWNQGHAEGAHHLGRGILERDIEALVPDLGTPLILYCGGGFRSALAAASLTQMGYTKVWSMSGGWRGWLKAGLPVVRPGES